MQPTRANLKMWIASIVLAFATAVGSLASVSLAEGVASEESNVEVTELVKFEVDGEEKIVENRKRRIRRRAIACRRTDNGQLNAPKKSDAIEHFSERNYHMGCGSHLRI